MTRDECLRMLDELFELNPGTLKDETRLGQQEGWDSMKVVEFIAFMDDRFNVMVSPEILKACKTIGDLVALMQKHPNS